ncbi:muscle M-line assembly protein unc-89-like [Brachionichthys hirsutus]|uniref:muscle M-line assembly protein unc-89-like n=1 Tax=Brachionichthys hirsutus TaxID=412623 RepID=UPI0036053F78
MAMKDASGMLSFLTSDLDQYLRDRPVESQQGPEEDITQDTFEQVVLTKDKDKNALPFVTDEKHTILNTTTQGKDQSPKADEEPELQEVQIVKITSSQKSMAMKDASGMLSFLTSDLDQYLRDRPVESQQGPEEDITQDTFEQVVLTKDKDKKVLPFVTDEKQTLVSTTTQGKGQSPKADEEPELQEVQIVKITSSQKSMAIKDASGMLSFLTSDLDQYLRDRPVESQQGPEEDITQDTFEQVVLTKDKDKNALPFVTDEKHTIVSTTTQGKGQSPKADEEPELQEVQIVKITSSQKSMAIKDASGMLSFLTSDLDQYLQDRPVESQQGPEEDITQDTFEQVVLTKDKDKKVISFVTDEKQTLVSTTTQGKDQSPKADEEPELQEVQIVRKTSSQTPMAMKDASGMLSFLTSDLDQYLRDRPVESQQGPEEDITQDTFEQVVLTKDEDKNALPFVTDEKHTILNTTTQGKGQSPKADEEPELQEVQIVKITSSQKSMAMKDASGMLSFLTSDLDQYLRDRPVESQQGPEEDITQDTFEQVVLTKDKDKKVLPFVTDEKQTLVSTTTQGKGQSPKADEEPELQEVQIVRKTSSQKSMAIKDASGMLSFLTSDLDQYLRDRPVESQQGPEEDITQDTFEQVVLTKDKDKNALPFVTDEKHTIVSTTTQGKGQSPKADEEPEVQEVQIMRKTSSQTPMAMKDASGMLSFLTSDLDQYLRDRPVERQQGPEEDITQDTFEQRLGQVPRG